MTDRREILVRFAKMVYGKAQQRQPVTEVDINAYGREIRDDD